MAHTSLMRFPHQTLKRARSSQVHASSDNLKLITFDADGTLYADGAHFEQDNAMIAHIINLMRCNVHVGAATAVNVIMCSGCSAAVCGVDCGGAAMTQDTRAPLGTVRPDRSASGWSCAASPAGMHASAAPPLAKLITEFHFDLDHRTGQINSTHVCNNCTVQVGIVTAAGYPSEAHKFERRLAGLLDSFRALKLPAEITNRFHIMGG